MDSDPLLPSPPKHRRRIRVAPPSASQASSNRYLGSSGTLSSDPPLFSSDDFQSSALENYETATDANAQAGSAGEANNRKRRYRGTWWGQKLGGDLEQPKRSKKTKRTAFKSKRNVDSGVWLGSADSHDDGNESAALFTCGSDDSVFCEQSGFPTYGRVVTAAARAGVSRELPFPRNPPTNATDRRSQVTRRNDRIESRAHTKARDIINRCLEDGNDCVDLTHLEMKTIPSNILQSLAQLTKLPTVLDHGASAQIYAPLEPCLQLYLAGNSLTKVPKELFDLQNLQLLSLRQNKLSEIPCSIRKLTLLQELNVGVNKLRYLPWEILGLMQGGGVLRHLTLHPNQFIRLDDSEEVQWHVDTTSARIVALNPNSHQVSGTTSATPCVDSENFEERKPIHVATSAARYFDIEGRPEDKRRTTITNTPSLRDLALKACSRSPNFTRLFEEYKQRMHPFESSSTLSSSCSSSSASTELGYQDPILRSLNHVEEVRKTGEKVCSICNRVYVLDKVRWIEWWDCKPAESYGPNNERKQGQPFYPLPFMRRGCSWACAPSVAALENREA